MVPKAQAFSEEEEEKTTIESGWEEEASTTVEQGEVADKIRALGVDAPAPRGQGTNVTSTNPSVLDEPTVDEPRANLAVPMAATRAQARLLITSGNDCGAELHVLPGKSYTVGRAVDNDIVLTDIAVSRKHFDLRYETSSWVVVDRGSGNGTLVNNNLEDQPFMLANGDRIEIGNTTFRFEMPDGAPRQASSVSIERAQHDDDEEPSTVAGKPLRADEIMTPSQTPSPPALQRPKTLPPPAPMRSRSPSAGGAVPRLSPSAMSYPQAIPSAATTIPSLQQNQGRPLNGPTMLGDSMSMPLPNVMPMTIPGQGPPVAPSQLPAHYGYPQQSSQGPVIVAGTQMPRDATSTALVPPTPYNGVPLLVPQPAYAVLQLARRTKMILAGAGLTLFAAIATVAIIKGASGGGPAAGATPGDALLEPMKPETPGKTIQPIQPIELPKQAPPKAEPPKVDPPAPIAKVDPPKVELPKKDPPKVDPPRVDPSKKDPSKKDPPKKDPPKVDPPKPIAKSDPPTKKDPPPKRDPAPKRVGMDTSGVKSKAEQQFKSKRFSEAAATLRAAANGADPGDATDLRSEAGAYDLFGRAYNLGMAPATTAKDAYIALKKAKHFDADGVFSSEIQAKLAQVAPRAAGSFMAAKNYSEAKEAVATAEAAGGSNSTTQSVRSALEQTAGALYKEAMSELSADPSGAKAKLKQVQQMVDSKSTWYQKAAKALAS